MVPEWHGGKWQSWGVGSRVWGLCSGPQPSAPVRPHSPTRHGQGLHPVLPAMPWCFLDTKTEHLKGLNINQAPRPSLLLTRSRGPLRPTASTGGLMEEQRGPRSQLALSAVQTPPRLQESDDF